MRPLPTTSLRVTPTAYGWLVQDINFNIISQAFTRYQLIQIIERFNPCEL
jgi:hypothetical protein